MTEPINLDDKRARKQIDEVIAALNPSDQSLGNDDVCAIQNLLINAPADVDNDPTDIVGCGAHILVNYLSIAYDALDDVGKAELKDFLDECGNQNTIDFRTDKQKAMDAKRNK